VRRLQSLIVSRLAEFCQRPTGLQKADCRGKTIADRKSQIAEVKAENANRSDEVGFHFCNLQSDFCNPDPFASLGISAAGSRSSTP